MDVSFPGDISKLFSIFLSRKKMKDCQVQQSRTDGTYTLVMGGCSIYKSQELEEKKCNSASQVEHNCQVFFFLY